MPFNSWDWGRRLSVVILLESASQLCPLKSQVQFQGRGRSLFLVEAILIALTYSFVLPRVPACKDWAFHFSSCQFVLLLISLSHSSLDAVSFKATSLPFSRLNLSSLLTLLNAKVSSPLQQLGLRTLFLAHPSRAHLCCLTRSPISSRPASTALGVVFLHCWLASKDALAI